MSKPLIAALLLTLSLHAHGKKVALILGGGGEPEGPTTIFDAETVRFIKFFQKSNYEINIAFDGRHQKTKASLSRTLKSEPPPFTKATFEKQIDGIVSQIGKGELKAGDKVVVIINSHGVKRDQEITHSVSAEPAGTVVSLDPLLKLQSQLEAKEVKLAIVDLSCYSGASQFFRSNNTCVISASPDNSLAYTSFADSFSKNLKTDKSLEEIFLSSRAKDLFGPAQPQISTGAAKNADETLRQLSSFMNDPRTQAGLCLDCVDNDKGLVSQIKQLLNLTQNSKDKNLHTRFCDKFMAFHDTRSLASYDFRRFCADKATASHLDDLQSAMQNYIQKRERLNELTRNLEDEGYITVDGARLFRWYHFDAEYERKAYKAYYDDPKYSTGLEIQKQFLDEIDTLEQKVNEVRKKPEFKKYADLVKEYHSAIADIQDTTAAVTAAERHLYGKLYELGRDKNATHYSDACAEFQL